MKKLILFFLIASITSCDEKTDSNVSGVIMPLKVGNYWTFVDSMFDDVGNFVSSDTSTLSITGKKSIEYQNVSYEVFFWTWTTFGADHSWLTWNGLEGLYLFGGTSAKQDYILTKTLSIKYPANVNDQWEKYNVTYSSMDSSFRIYDTTTITCSSHNALLASPLGDLACYTYEYSEDFSATKQNYSGFRGANVRFMKRDAITTVRLYYIPDIGYAGLTDETDGIIAYKKTIIAYLADK